MDFEFKPHPLFKNGVFQTIASKFWPQKPEKETSVSHLVPLPDGDHLVLIEDRPMAWHQRQRIVVLVHGLVGFHGSYYMVRMCRTLMAEGYLVIRMNLRGAGPGLGLSQKLFHGGLSDDVRAVLLWISKKFPSSPITLMGFSLGGNMSLKMAGEDGMRPTGNCDSLVAISPPVDLEKSVRHVQKPVGRLFDYYFVNRLIKQVHRFYKLFPDTPPPPSFPFNITLMGFYQLYTAPRNGFQSVVDYYQYASAKYYLNSIRIPTLIISSLDDPVVAAESFQNLTPHPFIELRLTRHGGHVGFLDQKGCFQWLHAVIKNWLQGIENKQQFKKAS